MTATTPNTMISLLSCSNANQLADFCALAVPSIWGPLKQQSLKRTIAFKQFCQKVIKATQISCACIVLGLYYIHRLRSAYPYIHASIGSEIRLFTTALVLANKYLDDNTFTNKTWSEVSSIPISELNIMEMEFLSALHYNIHLPHDQYFQWVGQCQQWILPTIMQIKAQSNSTPTAPLTPTMKRSYQDTIDDHYQPQVQNNKRRSAYYPPPPSLSSSSSSSSSTPVNTKMPYTPPESFQPIPIAYSTPSTCYPTPNYTNDDQFCRPILSWSSSTSSSTSSSSSSFSFYPSRPSYSHVSSAFSAPISASLLETRVHCLEID
ncbi:unnamed protein product [Absidia cylindrospora]